LIYAVGVGAKKDDPHFVYGAYGYTSTKVPHRTATSLPLELGLAITHVECTLSNIHVDKDFAAIPTYPVSLQFKGDGQDVNLFSERVSEGWIPGIPRLDPNRIVRLIARTLPILF